MTRIWIAAMAAVMGSVAVAAAQALPAPPADSGTTSLDTRKIDEAKSSQGAAHRRPMGRSPFMTTGGRPAG